jgi:multiple sugar transport system ATP-binding protein
MAKIEIRGVSKSFGQAAALAPIDLELADRELLCLLGPSGCGKSTTLRLIAGLDSATSGRIEILGRDVTDLPPAARNVSMVFQSYALFPHLSVAENIVFGLKVRKVPAIERAARLKRAADVLGLEALLERKPSQLSGGQQQRVALGRAIVAQTPVCLMDEPLSNLDAQLRAEMRREIRALQQRLGITMVYVTHDQVEAMTMADRIVVLNNGVIEQVGSPLELYDRPANIFVAGFIGSPAMNLLKGTIRLNGGPTFLTEGGAALPLKGAPSGADGRAAVYGIRPEHFVLSGGDGEAEVSVIEPTGSETQVFAKLGGQKIVGVFRERIAAEPGSRLPMVPRPEAVHLFDAATGVRIN